MSDIVNRGTQPGDTTADSTFDAFGKVNQAFEDVDTNLNSKVDKVAGKGLSTDNFLADGDYANLRARATTKDDVGLGNVEDLTPAQLRAGTTKDDVGLGNVENYPVASQAEAQAGVATDKYMTPERTDDLFSSKMAFGLAEPTILTITGATSPTGANGDYWQLGTVGIRPAYTNGNYWILYIDAETKWIIVADNGGPDTAATRIFSRANSSPFGAYINESGSGSVQANEQGQVGDIYFKYYL